MKSGPNQFPSPPEAEVLDKFPTLTLDLPRVVDFAYDARKVVEIVYRNHRNELTTRKIVPDMFAWAKNDYHAESQWLIEGYDIAKREWRTFAMKDIIHWRTAL